ncbi:MAG: DoxX family protein [Syntrophobacteraceae bacterium]|nr:DoxX family protein [Syntrophobacteraceae bacterium]
MKKPLDFWLRLILGAIFIVSSVGKILDPGAFAKIVYNYQLLPDVLINLVAIILPWLELMLGICLMGGFRLPGAVTLANGLLVVFFGALVFNVARGLDVHCGCFSTSTEGDPATTWYLIRDAAFLLMGGYLFYAVMFARR